MYRRLLGLRGAKPIAPARIRDPVEILNQELISRDRRRGPNRPAARAGDDTLSGRTTAQVYELRRVAIYPSDPVFRDHTPRDPRKDDSKRRAEGRRRGEDASKRRADQRWEDEYKQRVGRRKKSRPSLYSPTVDYCNTRYAKTGTEYMRVSKRMNEKIHEFGRSGRLPAIELTEKTTRLLERHTRVLQEVELRLVDMRVGSLLADLLRRSKAWLPAAFRSEILGILDRSINIKVLAPSHKQGYKKERRSDLNVRLIQAIRSLQKYRFEERGKTGKQKVKQYKHKAAFILKIRQLNYAKPLLASILELASVGGRLRIEHDFATHERFVESVKLIQGLGDDEHRDHGSGTDLGHTESDSRADRPGLTASTTSAASSLT
ncbi:Uu.00g146460.m01.CDS01 [Anthostomella pinea]|uniref:Uu.00g146460.m01.CDS01 n=1 Tax=Anthostomella pinea TaxID=933095 RepID=A0AAI8YM32_9PEZI|nr:Uu.00g146460.m01.CDS01 [Anthostomella pinea]